MFLWKIHPSWFFTGHLDLGHRDPNPGLAPWWTWTRWCGCFGSFIARRTAVSLRDWKFIGKQHLSLKPFDVYIVDFSIVIKVVHVWQLLPYFKKLVADWTAMGEWVQHIAGLRLLHLAALLELRHVRGHVVGASNWSPTFVGDCESKTAGVEVDIMF